MEGLFTNLDNAKLRNEAIAHSAQDNRMPAWYRAINNPLFDVATLPLMFTGGGMALQAGKQAAKAGLKAGAKNMIGKEAGKYAAKKLPQEMAMGAGGLAGYEAASLLTDNPLLQALGGVGGAGLTGGLLSAGARNMVPGGASGASLRGLDNALGDVASNPMLTNAARALQSNKLLQEAIGNPKLLDKLSEATGISVDDLQTLLKDISPTELNQYATINEFLAAKLGNTAPIRVQNSLADEAIAANNYGLDETLRLAKDSMLSRHGLNSISELPEVVGDAVQNSLKEQEGIMRAQRSQEFSPQYKAAFNKARNMPEYDIALKNIKEIDPTALLKGKGVTKGDSTVAKLVSELQQETLESGLEGANFYTQAIETAARDASKNNNNALARVLNNLRAEVKDIVRRGAPMVEDLDKQFAERTAELTADRFGSLFSKLTKKRVGGLGEDRLEFATDPAKVVNTIAGGSESEVAKLANTLPTEIREELAGAILSQAENASGAKLDNLLTRAGIINPKIAPQVDNAKQNLALSRETKKATGTEFDKTRHIVTKAGRDLFEAITDLPGIQTLKNSETGKVVQDVAASAVGATKGTNIKAAAIQNPALFQEIVLKSSLPTSQKLSALKQGKRWQVDAKRLMGDTLTRTLPYSALSVAKGVGNAIYDD